MHGGILVGLHEQVHKAWDGTMFTKWSVVVSTQSQVANQTNNGLDQGPSAWWMQEFYEHRKTVVESNCILGHLGIGMS
jgi:hypothetical protein